MNPADLKLGDLWVCPRCDAEWFENLHPETSLDHPPECGPCHGEQMVYVGRGWSRYRYLLGAAITRLGQRLAGWPR